MKNKKKFFDHSGNWVGIGTAIGVAVFATTNDPTWIGVGVAIGAALSLSNRKKDGEE